MALYLSKTLALVHFDEKDNLKITRINDTANESAVLQALVTLGQMHEFDVSDDELLAHMCAGRGLFTYREWQELIDLHLERVRAIDREVDPRLRRLTLDEELYLMGGCTGRVTAGGYKMLSALAGRELVMKDVPSFVRKFGSEPREFIEEVWRELDELLSSGAVSGEYTHELFDSKHSKII